MASDVALSRPLRQIIWANVVTPYNALLLTLTLLVATTHRWGDTLVGLFVVLNSGIGIAQEVRARHILDQLSVVHAPTVRVVRQSTEVVIGVTNLVVGDVMQLSTGDQVPADGVATSVGLEVNESLLSGESEPIMKDLGDELLSGSMVVAGSGTVEVTKVGDDAYARQLTADVRRLLSNVPCHPHGRHQSLTHHGHGILGSGGSTAAARGADSPWRIGGDCIPGSTGHDHQGGVGGSPCHRCRRSPTRWCPHAGHGVRFREMNIAAKDQRSAMADRIADVAVFGRVSPTRSASSSAHCNTQVMWWP